MQLLLKGHHLKMQLQGQTCCCEDRGTSIQVRVFKRRDSDSKIGVRSLGRATVTRVGGRVVKVRVQL